MNADQSQIHPTAIISPKAKLGKLVRVGPYSIIHDNVQIGDNTSIGPYCVLGEPLAAFYRENHYENPPLVIGEGSIIRSHTVIYAGSTLGRGFECGHRVTIREKSAIGIHVRCGTLTDIQGDCTFGDYVRLHSNVFIPQESHIGNFVWIFAGTVLTNDPTPPSETLCGIAIEDFAVLAAKVTVLPGVRIGPDALVGAMSLVRTDVPNEAVVVGNPAKQINTVRSLRSRDTGEPIYPWRYHFDRGMPWQGIGFDQWLEKNPRYRRT